ncbi:MAG: hypothetical protein O3C51_03695 [Planctomycetota bacterium]|nr:hypothetical protein [Planctomycetota bacterium]
MQRAHLVRAALGAALLLVDSAIAQAPASAAGLEFRCVGPTRGGRVTAVAGVRQRRGEFYMGATGGGVFKTRDFGSRWENVSDGFFASPSIGAIRVAPSNPDVVWVGTGSEALRSNVIQGAGVYRSVDAGKSWSFVGLGDAGQIGAVEVDPRDPDVAYVAVVGKAFRPSAERGLYRTTDGGETWERLLFVSERTGIVDVEISPADPNVLYAAAWTAERKPWTIRSGSEEGGVFRSMDAGATWTRLTEGLPGGVVGKADLAVTPAAPARVYVLIEAPDDVGGVYRSDDGGDHFEQTSSDSGPRVRPFYYTNIDADPQDADRVYVSATGFYRSTDGGKTFRRRGTPHGDNHDLWIHPDDSDLMVQANDGGANVTLDGGDTWSTQDNQPTAELYQVAFDEREPYWLYAGQQDNTTIRVPVLPPRAALGGAASFWEAVGGCETGPAVPNPGDPDVVYAACKGRFQVYRARTGQTQSYDVTAANMYGHDPKDLRDRFQRVSPIHVSPHDPGVVYHASQFVYRTRDEGRTWDRISPDLTAFDPERQGISGEPITRDITGEEFYSCLYALKESPRVEGLIWVGANDGPIHVTRDGGRTWSDVTPAQIEPGGRVQCVEPSPHADGTAFVTVLRYQLGDDRPYALRTRDFGASWALITDGSNGIPADEPVRVVRADPVREGLLYCGTERGLYLSFDDGGVWQPLRQGLPVVPVTDIAIHPRGDLVLSTMGRSFWVLDDLGPLRAFGAGLADDVLAWAEPSRALRQHHRGSRSIPEYPSPGAVLDYWVPEGFGGELTLEVRGPSGELVRVISSESPGEEWVEPDEPGMRALELLRVGTPKLPKAPGANRFRWDMQHAGAWHPDRRRAGGQGPMVAPGRYRLRLSGAGLRAEAELDVALEQRVLDEGVTLEDVKAQERIGLQIRDAISRARRIEAQAAEETDDEALRAVRAEVLVALRTARGTYQQPMLLDQLGYLAGIVRGADQAPGRDVEERLAEWEAQLADLDSRLRR